MIIFCAVCLRYLEYWNFGMVGFPMGAPRLSTFPLFQFVMLI